MIDQHRCVVSGGLNRQSFQSNCLTCFISIRKYYLASGGKSALAVTLYRTTEQGSGTAIDDSYRSGKGYPIHRHSAVSLSACVRSIVEEQSAVHHVVLGMSCCSAAGLLIVDLLRFDLLIVEFDIRILQRQSTVVDADRIIAEPFHIEGCPGSFRCASDHVGCDIVDLKI